jgi:hypothetical protein
MIEADRNYQRIAVDSSVLDLVYINNLGKNTTAKN